MPAKRKRVLFQSATNIGSITTSRMKKGAGRSFYFAGASCIGNTLLGIGKLVMGIFSISPFACASAFYTLGMVAAKCCALAGVPKEDAARFRYYKWSGLVLVLSSLMYVAYSARLFFFPAANTYHMYVALGIATFTFAELGLNIRGIIIYRHTQMALVHAIKMINLASSLICLVLTQSAILSFTESGSSHIPTANGFMGVLMGSVATAIGIIMIRRITRIQKQEAGGQIHD